jgi:hypothetical protein
LLIGLATIRTAVRFGYRAKSVVFRGCRAILTGIGQPGWIAARPSGNRARPKTMTPCGSATGWLWLGRLLASSLRQISVGSFKVQARGGGLA